MDRRQYARPQLSESRRPSLRGHAVTVGTSANRPHWLVASCQCGEVAESTVDGMVEAWVVWHRMQVSHGD